MSKPKSARYAKANNAGCSRYKHFYLRRPWWKAGKFTIILTDAIAREYLDVIQRPKFKIPPGEIVATTDYLLQTAEFVTVEEEITVIIADLTDNKFLEAAVAGKVNFIVSGDSHLLELRSFREIPIITAREFVDWLSSQ